MDTNYGINSHELFNKMQVYDGFRIDASGNKPSVYISIVKLKRKFKAFTDEQIEELFDDEMTTKTNRPSLVQLRNARRKLFDKLESLLDWQAFQAVELSMREDVFDSGLLAAAFVLQCQANDKNPERENLADNSHEEK